MGTLALEEALRGIALDFFIVFSSVSSIVPPAGQIDYAAASAFLDAFALNRKGGHVLAIDWGRWREVGMMAGESGAHPLLQQGRLKTNDELECSSQFKCDEQWLLSEHRLKSGAALLPGTGYLEMAAAALTQGSFGSGVIFQDVFFLSPLVCEPSRTKEVLTRLSRNGSESFLFSVLSRDSDWTEHVSGQISKCTLKPSEKRNIDEILGNCRVRTLTFDVSRRTRQESYFDFGPRWWSLQKLSLGEREALAALELSADLEGDLAEFHIHPALLDLATASALYLIPNYEDLGFAYLPFSYRKVCVFRPLPARLFSYIRSRSENVIESEIATFDITLLDPSGQILAEIEGFSLRRISDLSVALSRTELGHSATTRIEAAAAASTTIGPLEGGRAFLRALSIHEPEIVISAADPRSVSSVSPARRVQRPSPPESEIEAVLGEWWQELLGIEHVRSDDDFFDLGGHSLIVLRLFNKIKKTYGLEFGLSTMFEARTIRQLANLIRESRREPQATLKPSPSVVPIQPKGMRPPLYVISGLGGNVIKFHSLAFHLGNEQPMFGLLPRGLDGKEPFLTRIEDMAQHYVDVIRLAQLEGPYNLIGYSFGGIVAFEVARQLASKGILPSLVGMLDTREWSYMEKIGQSFSMGRRYNAYRQRLKNLLAGEDKFDGIRQFIAGRSAKWTYQIFKAVGRPVPQSIGTIEDINAFAAANYKPKPYPGKLTIFRSTTRELPEDQDEFLGWGCLASEIEVQDVPSSHYDILQEPGVKVLADKLSETLLRIEGTFTERRSVADEGGHANSNIDGQTISQ